jgi:hypothetical protein
MNKLIFTLNVLIVLSILPAHSMKKENQLTLPVNTQNNSDCPLPDFKLEDELIFACCLTQPKKSPVESKKALEDSIKNFIHMRATCKNFYKSLTFEKIGNFCKNHSAYAKNVIFHEINSLPSLNFRCRPLILILIHADARFQHQQDRLLEDSINYSDAYMLETLLNHQAKLSEKREHRDPLIFSAKTVEIAEILMNNGIDIHASRDTSYNFLSDLLRRNTKYSIEWTHKTRLMSDGTEFSFDEGETETEYICPKHQSTWDLIEFCLEQNVFMSDEDRELYNKFTNQLSAEEKKESRTCTLF